MFVISNPTSSWCAMNIIGSRSGPTSRTRFPSTSVDTRERAHSGSALTIASRTGRSCPETAGTSANDLSSSAIDDNSALADPCSLKSGFDLVISGSATHRKDPFPSTTDACATTANNAFASATLTLSTSDPANRLLTANTSLIAELTDSGTYASFSILRWTIINEPGFKSDSSTTVT